MKKCHFTATRFLFSVPVEIFSVTDGQIRPHREIRRPLKPNTHKLSPSPSTTTHLRRLLFSH
uniref:Uncharacterized protein n=1 Tax=Cannabis sativa TaxID=3483 RepID=A0A803R7U4_CANSA